MPAPPVRRREHSGLGFADLRRIGIDNWGRFGGPCFVAVDHAKPLTGGEDMLAKETPHDPRSRAVTAIIDARKGAVAVQLECGHVTHRRPMCKPSRAICQEC
jgi:hypothetical protein